MIKPPENTANEEDFPWVGKVFKVTPVKVHFEWSDKSTGEWRKRKNILKSEVVKKPQILAKFSKLAVRVQYQQALKNF